MGLAVVLVMPLRAGVAWERTITVGLVHILMTRRRAETMWDRKEGRRRARFCRRGGQSSPIEQERKNYSKLQLQQLFFNYLPGAVFE